MTTKTKPRPNLNDLPPETWGERLCRARKRTGIALAELDAAFPEVSKSTIHRLEQLDEPPTGKKQRQIAFMVVLACGYKPAEFDLTEADVPSYIDLDRVADLLLDRISWFDESPGPKLPAPA